MPYLRDDGLVDVVAATISRVINDKGWDSITEEERARSREAALAVIDDLGLTETRSRAELSLRPRPQDV
ncbi:hypothetical protein [Litorisediminicola beolgyonensis]|uniref:Uncharacterized protein n=1 Tax=Litorisediminicola beolgyonensis TaxID=1173614 RepID=A0ABW3ZGB4_9RHOB